MIAIIVIIYIFYLWYFISSWKLLAENAQVSSDKIHSPFLLNTTSPKNWKSASTPFLPTLEDFQAPLQKEEWGH